MYKCMNVSRVFPCMNVSRMIMNVWIKGCIGEWIGEYIMNGWIVIMNVWIYNEWVNI